MTEALRCEGITKSFRRTAVLRGVDLTVAPGEAVAIVGENGSGKSTMLNVCAGVLSPDAGSIERGGSVVLPPGAGTHRPADDP